MKKFKEFDSGLEGFFVMGVYHQIFEEFWQIENEAGKKNTFSDAQQVRTARCNVAFFWGRCQCWAYIVVWNPGTDRKGQKLGDCL